ncbi:hypothetical protein BJ165DRAFT_1511859 [Panaeolus papilionaceus]|nr:hypothetical protein BJ165DRAFT_1511859 [Panaeolus papilionaceus]
MSEDANVISELLEGDVATSMVYVHLQRAACMNNIRESTDAADVSEHEHLVHPTNNDAKMKLQSYEILAETRKALKLVYEVVDSLKSTQPAPQQKTQPPPPFSPNTSP